jgi:hypothetical protein
MVAMLATFVLSFCYNGIGLGLAVQGRFTPIVSTDDGEHGNKKQKFHFIS